MCHLTVGSCCILQLRCAFLGNLGVRPEYIGFLLLIAVIAEIVFFFISDSLFKKGSVTTLLMFSVTASIIRWVSLFLFEDVFIFILSQLLHAFTFGLTQVAFMKYLDRHIKINFSHMLTGYTQL
ncbi:MFS transporter [Bacillus sp. B6(2022)]|nr:MFS transporter [Bacillus sp. B6(2022)]